MKNVIFFSLFLGLLLFSCQSDREKFAEDTTVDGNFVFDFGEVMQGELVKVRFEIKNTGKVALKIFEVKPSCGCTLADYSKDAVEPGKTAWVEAEVDTKALYGTISKTVSVMANTQPTTIPLQITGKVLSKDL
jgi:hypothetical protein